MAKLRLRQIANHDSVEMKPKANAVDMMDNADALTTCPQQQQQTNVSGSVIERDQERSVSN